MSRIEVNDSFNNCFCILFSLACGVIANILALSFFDIEVGDFFPLSELDKGAVIVLVVSILAAVSPIFLGIRIAEGVLYWYDYWKLIIFIPIVAALCTLLGTIIWVIVCAFIYEGPVIAFLAALIGGVISAPTIFIIRIFVN